MFLHQHHSSPLIWLCHLAVTSPPPPDVYFRLGLVTLPNCNDFMTYNHYQTAQFPS